VLLNLFVVSETEDVDWNHDLVVQFLKQKLFDPSGVNELLQIRD